jgi:hypothetical protein
MVPGGPRQPVRVSGRDGHHYFMGFTETIERSGSGRTRAMVTFGETPEGTPPPIAAWYPIGSSQAHRFLYPSVAR